MLDLHLVNLTPFIPRVAERASVSEARVRAYLDSDEQDPSLFAAFAFFQVFPVGKWPAALPWCIARYAVSPATGAQRNHAPEVMADLLCADVPPHNLCGPLSMKVGRLYFPDGRITDAITRFATKEAAEEAIGAMEYRPAAARDVAVKVAELHFFVVRVDLHDATRRMIYDGGDYWEAVIAHRAATEDGKAFVASFPGPRAAIDVRIHARPRTTITSTSTSPTW